MLLKAREKIKKQKHNKNTEEGFSQLQRCTWLENSLGWGQFWARQGFSSIPGLHLPDASRASPVL
jgi:hypothetical protein